MQNINKDIAEKNHWDEIYDKNDSSSILGGWTPITYEALCLEKMLSDEIEKYKPKKILEIGCGNSTWLPYLVKKYNVEIVGMDYSEGGCDLARAQLKAENVDAEVICMDLYTANIEEIGQFDLVYSLGLIEHFESTEDIVKQLLKFVKPGKRLLTEVPNLKSIHGFLSWSYQPKQLDKHVLLSFKDIKKACINNNCSNIDGKYIGFFSFNIVAWGMNQRAPVLDVVILPITRFLNKSINYVAKIVMIYKGNKLFSPFIYVGCTKEKSLM